MTRDEFWQIVDRVHGVSGGGVDIGAKEELLADELRGLPLEEVQSFSDHFDECMDRAYSNELWAAAFIIGGGCSDDANMDFRSSLISMGRAIFEAALADPESLVELEDDAEELFYQGYQSVPHNVAEELDGKLTRSRPHPRDPSGRDWEESDLPTMFPKLWERYDYSGD